MTHVTGTKSNAVLAASVITEILALSIDVYSSPELGAAADRMHHEDGNDMTETSSIPQSNDDSVLKAEASNALFQPAAGLSDVFGPDGLFTLEDVFDCDEEEDE